MNISSHCTITSTEDGLHLDGTILWFDAFKNGDLSFLSSATNELSHHLGPQFLATEETLKIIETYSKKPKALVCQYNRPFSIGKLKMELLPSGSILGGALLHVEVDQDKLLYAPHPLLQNSGTVRQLQLKRANILTLGAYQPLTNMPNRKRELEKLIETTLFYVEQGIYPTIFCEPSPVGQEITKLLSDNSIPVAVHSAIHKINRVYKAYGSDLGRYSLYSTRRSKDRVILLPTSLIKRSSSTLLQLLDGPIIFAETGMDRTDYPDLYRKINHHFHISTSCDLRDLKEIITAVCAKQLYFIGPYAKQYADEFKNCAPLVVPLFNNHQPTLF